MHVCKLRYNNSLQTEAASRLGLIQALGPTVGEPVYAIIAMAFCLLLGVMTATHGVAALLWVPIGFAFGIFVTPQILLPLMLGLPRAAFLVAKRQMQAAVFIRIVFTALLFLALIFVVLFVIGFLWPKAADYLYNNASLNLAMWLGTIAIILCPLSKKCRSDYRADFDKSYRKFLIESGEFRPEGQVDLFKGSNDLFSPSRIEAIEIETRNSVYATIEAYESALELIRPFTERADNFVVQISASYSEAELGAHGLAIDVLTTALENLGVSFEALSATDGIHAIGAELYDTACAAYEGATDSYYHAAISANRNALEAKLQATKDELDALVLHAGETNPSQPNPQEIRARALAIEVKAANDAAVAERLEQASILAEAKAESLCENARLKKSYAAMLAEMFPR